MTDIRDTTFGRRYFMLTTYRMRADRFAERLGYRTAMEVPAEDLLAFVEMFEDEMFGLTEKEVAG